MKCPYTFPHRSRKAKVDYITGIGGYYSRHERYAVEFTVGTYYAKLDAEHLVPLMDDPCVDLEDPVLAAKYTALAEEVAKENESNLWSWAIEDAQRNVLEADAYRMLWDGTQVNVELVLEGRGGKHLCIKELEGVSFTRSEQELEEVLMNQYLPDGEETWEYSTLRKGAEWAIKNETLDTIYRYLRHCEIDFTSEKASKEVEHQAAYHLRRLANDRWEELELARVTREEHLARWKELYEAADGKVDVALLDAVLSQTEFTPSQVRGDE